MSTARRLEGKPVAATVLASVAERVDRLADRGITPVLGTVLASDDPADARFLKLKLDAAADLGIETRDVSVDPDADDAVEDAVVALSGDDAVHAIFVQTPLPAGTDEYAVRRGVDSRKDVDCFHPANLGALVSGQPQFVPATTAAVLRLLEYYEVPTAGADAVVVGRSPVIGRPLANRLWGTHAAGHATVTVCHTFTEDLGAKTRGADIVITAAGQPGLVDGAMLSDGVTAVDVSATRTSRDGEVTYVGDVEFESVAAVANAVTPVPGGVGPVSVAMLMENVLDACERQSAPWGRWP